jgi:hypothetical protein
MCDPGLDLRGRIDRSTHFLASRLRSRSMCCLDTSDGTGLPRRRGGARAVGGGRSLCGAGAASASAVLAHALISPRMARWIRSTRTFDVPKNVPAWVLACRGPQWIVMGAQKQKSPQRRASSKFQKTLLECLRTYISGAQERTRTSTMLPPLGPEPSASTNSATWARFACYCSAKTAILACRPSLST